MCAGLAPGIPTILPPQAGFMMAPTAPLIGATAQKRPAPAVVVEDDTGGKKAKTEEQLIPEDVFLQSNKVMLYHVLYFCEKSAVSSYKEVYFSKFVFICCAACQLCVSAV
jgi:hypothetical protein